MGDFSITLSGTYIFLLGGGLLLVFALIVTYVRNLEAKAIIKNSQLQRAFDKLKGRENTLSLIYENASDFIGLLQPINQDFIVVQLPGRYLNDIEKYTPYKRDQVIGHSISFLYNKVLKLTSEEKQWRFDNLNQLVANLEMLKYEEEFVRPDGSRGIALSSLIPITSKNKCDFVLYVSRDITDEKATERKLERAVNLFQSLVEDNPAATLLINYEGKIESVNKKFREYFGYTEEEVLDKDARMIVPEKHYPLLVKVQKELTENPRVFNFGREEQLSALRKDGSSFNCELMISPVTIEEKLYVITTMLDVTYYHAAQRILEERREQLQSLIDNMPGMAYRVGSESPYGVEFVSEKSKEVLGLSPKEIYEQGLTPADVIAEEFHDEIKEKAAIALQTGERQEVIVRTADERRKWLIDRFKPVKLSSGRVVFDGLLIDVTDNFENQARLKAAVEGAEQGMWDWDIKTNVVHSNAFQASMLGFEPEEIEHTFNWWAQRVHPDDVDDTYQVLIKNVKGESETFETEYRIRTKGDKYKWILVKGRVIERNKDGRAIRALGVHLDINNRKNMELELRKSRARLQALVSNLPGMVYQSSVEDFSMSFVSEGAKKLTGYSPKDFISGKVSLFGLIKNTYHERVRDEVKKALKEKRPYNLIYEIDTPGGVKWLYDKGQELEAGYLEGIITDITERVEAEERIIQTIIETEDRERERIARELHDNLGQKLTTASLNFNALKSRILDDKDLTERMSKGLNYLTDAIKDAREISHNLMPRSIEDFGFALSVESLITDLNRLSETKFEFYHNLGEKNLDNNLGIHLYRITQEAVNNVMKYARAQSAVLQLMAYEDIIIWSIEDDGVGFDKEEVMSNHHFGLDSIRHRVQILSGNLEINSFKGRGTTLTIEIPAKKQYFHEQNTHADS